MVSVSCPRIRKTWSIRTETYSRFSDQVILQELCKEIRSQRNVSKKRKSSGKDFGILRRDLSKHPSKLEVSPEWEVSNSFVSLFSYNWNQFSSFLRGTVRWVLLFAVVVAILNYGSGHAREFFCQWGIGGDKHCDHRPATWNRGLFP